MLSNRLSRPKFWHPGFSTQMLLDSITVSHIIESMAVILRRAGAHSDTVLDHLSANRAVIIIYSNRAFSTDYSQCSHCTKSFTFSYFMSKLPMCQLHGIALS